MANSYTPLYSKNLNEQQRQYLADLFLRLKPYIEANGEVCAEDFELRQAFPTESLINVQASLDYARQNGELRISREWVIETPSGTTYRGLPSYALV